MRAETIDLHESMRAIESNKISSHKSIKYRLEKVLRWMQMDADGRRWMQMAYLVLLQLL